MVVVVIDRSKNVSLLMENMVFSYARKKTGPEGNKKKNNNQTGVGESITSMSQAQR